MCEWSDHGSSMNRRFGRVGPQFRRQNGRMKEGDDPSATRKGPDALLLVTERSELGEQPRHPETILCGATDTVIANSSRFTLRPLFSIPALRATPTHPEESEVMKVIYEKDGLIPSCSTISYLSRTRSRISSPSTGLVSSYRAMTRFQYDAQLIK